MKFGNDPERSRFLDIAAAALVHCHATRLQTLPVNVAERAYDLALDTILRRVINGVEAFRDEHGEQCPPKISSYVHDTLGWKIKTALKQQPATVLFNEAIAAASPASTIAEQLDEHCRDESLLEQASRQLQRIRLAAVECDERRLRLIERTLHQHGVKTRAQAIVLARATRRWTHDITPDGVERRYHPPTPWRIIAANLNETPTTARQIYRRTLRQLPDALRILVENPDAITADRTSSASRPTTAAAEP